MAASSSHTNDISTDIPVEDVYAEFLNKGTIVPPRILIDADGTSRPNLAYNRWTLIDQNLAAAICSKITVGILSYVLNLDTCRYLEHSGMSTASYKLFQIHIAQE